MDTHKLKLEHEISTYINKDNGCTVHFEYEPEMGNMEKVSAYTFNPVSEEKFLLASSAGVTEEGALVSILEYVKKQKGLNSFTVEWARVGTSDKNISYFYCHDVMDVVKKFFAGKNTVDYVVYDIHLNPMA